MTIPSAIESHTELAIEPGVAAERAIEGRSTWQLAWMRLRKDKAAVVSFVVIVLIVLMAIFAPVVASLTGHGVDQQFRTTGLNGFGQPVGPNGTFLLGTDDLGRDILVRIAYGARISLLVGVVATLIMVAIGTVLGLMAGYLGGIVDSIIARLIDLVLSLPFLLFAISLVSVTHPGLAVVIIVIAVFNWAAVARIVRGQVLSIREKEYIEAARSLGAGPLRIMFVDVLPNVLTQLIVYATLLIPVTIVLEATLSFLGLGIPPPTADWGQMIAESEGVYQQAWWFLVFPGLALLVTTLSFNILGDGVRDALDPRLERR
ncbi:MAG: ABC transporter permease [Acidimicrobiales bacterium]|nr:ABC transporter permease [Acidimicrobiales bacterium]